ncbi:hypothetical protein HY948_01255 [Candidatus Gottesmanbacteria bacterium]|nr:hypothetical protein [Candidatus Gottesmanbacteria bacterium]
MDDDPHSEIEYLLGESSIQQAIETLKRVLAPYHDATDHEFEADPEHPAFCIHCKWISYDVPDTIGCTHTVREHAEIILADMQNTVKRVEHLLGKLVSFAALIAMMEAEGFSEDDETMTQARRRAQAPWN